MKRLPVFIYIIGQIKGLPIEVAEANFERAETQLREIGFNPVNPLKLGIPKHFEYKDSRPHNMKALHPCEAVFVQSNWRLSEGSMDEINESMKTGKNIYYAESRGMEQLKEHASLIFEKES